ncbi:hypothetical protein M8J77_026179 [Diaphorina citri]|nr:hypothetical protein M8J77_026179 [Diaphorina citri]
MALAISHMLNAHHSIGNQKLNIKCTILLSWNQCRFQFELKLPPITGPCHSDSDDCRSIASLPEYSRLETDGILAISTQNQKVIMAHLMKVMSLICSTFSDRQCSKE